MEGDYYDYEKNLSRSFDSEQNARHFESRKRQRREAPILTDLNTSPLSADTQAHSASVKGRSALHHNFYSEGVVGPSPSQTYHQHPYYNYNSSERPTDGHRYYPVSDQPYKDTPLPQYGERTASHSHPSSSPAGDARQPYYYNHHHHHNPYTPSQYAPVQWDPYSYHHYQQIQHSQQSWNSSTPQYHSNDDSPNNETAPNRFSHYTTKDGRPQDFLRQAAPPSYPYYFPSYPVYYPQHGSDYAKMPAQNTLYPAPDGMSTQPQDIPAQRTMSLYMACDEDRLSEYQCLARKQIEVFSATYSDLKMTVQGRNRQVLPGQVGIRCRFCSHIPVKKQARASVYYPSKLDCIYQAAQNMASVHLAKYCSFVPEDIRNELQRHMKDRKSSAGGGKEYWAVSARSLGIEECDGRLRFATPITDDSSRAT